MATNSENTERTYHYDKWRSPFYGILEAGWNTFALVVAIRYFEAPDQIKAFIAGAGPMGFLLTPLTLYVAARMRIRPSRACYAIFLFTAALLLGATTAQSLLLFAVFAVSSQMISVQQGPLMLQIYAENYESRERGARLSTPLILMSSAAIAYSVMGGWLLDLSINYYRLLFTIMCLAAIGCAWASSKIPSRPLSTDNVGNPWQNLSLMWQDRFFGYLLATWMLLGLGNLITMPMRIEYLANPDFGINASNKTIAFLMMIVPYFARVLSTKLWGYLFDRLHFITTRNLLNLCFLFGIALFFFTRNLICLSVAMALTGMAMGGGKIIWGLWVTKIAPDEKASSYMSVHMALTGLRGSLAPFIGYYILSQADMAWVASVGLALITISILLFERVRSHERLKQV